MNEEKVYQFNEYVLGYDKGYNDRSCLIISKILNDNMYVMSSLYDGSADVISLMLDNLQEEIRQTKLLKERYQLQKDKYKEVLDKIKDKTNKMIESNNSALSNPEYTIVSKHQLLKLSNEELKDILKLLEEIE